MTSEVTAPESVAYEGRWSEAVAWWLFIAGCVTLPWTAVQAADLPVSDALFAAAAYLLIISPGRHHPAASPTLTVAGTAVLTASLLASVHAEQVSASVAVGLRVVWLFTVWAWLIRRLGRSAEQLAVIVWAYCAGAAVSAGLAAWQVATGTSLAFGRADGLTGHVNDAGGTLALAVAFSAALIAQRRRPLLATASLTVAATGLALSGSITGTAAAAGGALTVVLLHKVRVRVLVLAAGAVAVAWWAVGLLPEAVNPLARLAEATGAGRTGTLQLRIGTWRFAWNGILAGPWTGVGLDPASGGTIVYTGTQTSQLATHNLLLLAWYQGGLLLLGGFILVLVGAFSRIRRARGMQRDVLASAAVGVLIFGMTAPVLFHRYFWLPILLAYALPAKDRVPGAAPGQRASISLAAARSGTSRGVRA